MLVDLFVQCESLFVGVLGVIFGALFIWGLVNGVLLLEGRPGTERSLFIFWLIQVPTLGSPLLTYFFESGFLLTIRLGFAPIGVNGNFLLGSSFDFFLLQAGRPWYIGVNVVAAAIAWWLYCGLRSVAAGAQTPVVQSAQISSE